MKIRLRVDFDSIAEMQDWIATEAAFMRRHPDKWAEDVLTDPQVEWTESTIPVTKEAVTQINERKAELKRDMEEQIEAKPKPKRKRRTKAEMAAARAAEEAAKKEAVPPEVDEALMKEEYDPEPPAEVEPVKSNGDLLRDFQVLLENPSVANQAIAVLDDVAAAQPVGVRRRFSSPVRFSDLPEAAQAQVIEQARGLL